ncbi:MAG: hypothetical protein K5653_00645 [Clostridiales bacterium]|nr:hypothetical protein [Clostridiales bacterium]
MIKEYKFYNAEPLIQFISDNKDKIIGQHIRKFYSTKAIMEMSDIPIVFVLDDYSVIVSYFIYSDMTLHIVDSQIKGKEICLNFLYKDFPGSDILDERAFEIEDFAFIDQEISDIHIERFSHEFETNPSTGETRPEGGDYFSMITVDMCDGQKLHICAADTLYDGYVEFW